MHAEGYLIVLSEPGKEVTEEAFHGQSPIPPFP